MKRSSAKAKGRKLQDWVRNKLISFLTQQPKVIDIESHVRCAIMGESGADVQLSPSIIHYFPFSIECKNQEKFSGIYNIMDQASAEIVMSDCNSYLKKFSSITGFWLSMYL